MRPRKTPAAPPDPAAHDTLTPPAAAIEGQASPDDAFSDVEPRTDAVAWDEQPTVNLVGEDPIAAPGDDDAAAAEGEAREATADEEGPVEQARALSQAHLRGLLEALVFASDRPLKSGELARLASAPVKHVRELLAELKVDYAARGVVLDEVAGGWLFRTSVQFAPFVREMSSERPVRLTRAQVETLAIVAYRQPVTRPEIDDIRGVDSGATLKLLLERELIRILGKKDEPGRPMLYGTSTAFLEFFGLKSLRDLPTLKEFTELSDESRRVAEVELHDVVPETEQRAPDTVAPPLAEHDTIMPVASTAGDEEP